MVKCSKWLVFSYRIEDFFLNFVITFLSLTNCVTCHPIDLSGNITWKQIMNNTTIISNKKQDWPGILGMFMKKIGGFVCGFCDKLFFKDCDQVLHEGMHKVETHISAMIVEENLMEMRFVKIQRFSSFWKQSSLSLVQLWSKRLISS